MKLLVFSLIAAFTGSASLAVTADGTATVQGAQWFSEITAQALQNLTNDYTQFQQMVADRTTQLTSALKDAENGNAAVEMQSAQIETEISVLQKNIKSLKGQATYTTQENKRLRENLQVLSQKMRAAQAAAEAAVEGSDGGEAAAIAAAEAPATMSAPAVVVAPMPVNQQQNPMQATFVNAMPQNGDNDLVEQPHSADQDNSDENGDADDQQQGEPSQQQPLQQQPVPQVNAAAGAPLQQQQPQQQQQPLQQQQLPQQVALQQQGRQQQQQPQQQPQEDDGYSEAFGSDGMVDPDAGYSFLEVSSGKRFQPRRRNMLRRGRLGAAQMRSRVVGSSGQIVSLLTQGAEQYAQQEEYNVATLQNSYQGAMFMLTRRHAELQAQQVKLSSTQESLAKLHSRLAGTVNKLEATRGHLQQHVTELEGVFRQLGHGAEPTAVHP